MILRHRLQAVVGYYKLDTISTKFSESCGWDVVELAVGMCHKLVALLGSGIKRYRVVNLIIS